jgi:hypothetical protein
MEKQGIPLELTKALGVFESKAETIVREFLLQQESRKAPETIYHYTNDAGLRGVLEAGTLWLSDIFSLNDPSELSHGVSHAVKILNQKAESGPDETKVFARHFEEFHERGMEGSAHYFVCSFSEDGNELGQWRAYADDGRGYAIGFDGKALEAAFTQDNGVAIPNNSTHHVLYDDAQLASIHRAMIDELFALISLPRGKGMSGESINAYMKELSISLSLYALRASLFFKHEAYMNEREFRFIQIHRADIPPPEVKRRYRAYELVKYREFDWRRTAAGSLKRVVVGPATDGRKGERFATDCLAAFHTGKVEVVGSDIPYRAV